MPIKQKILLTFWVLFRLSFMFFSFWGDQNWKLVTWSRYGYINVCNLTAVFLGFFKRAQQVQSSIFNISYLILVLWVCEYCYQFPCWIFLVVYGLYCPYSIIFNCWYYFLRRVFGFSTKDEIIWGFKLLKSFLEVLIESLGIFFLYSNNKG